MTLQTPPTPTTATRPLPAAPPEWAIERAVKRVGKATGAAGRALDRLAKVPVVGAVVRFFSSIWIGIGVLLLLAIYIALGSGFATMRARMEMTDLQFFNWYPMRVLVGWLALNLTVVTLRRIPLTLFKLGSWTVHVGILTLIGGSVWYFSHKTEGAVRIYLGQTKDAYYDATERALYAYPVRSDGTIDEAHGTMTPLPGLPIFYDHVSKLGTGLDMAVPGRAFAGLGEGMAGVSARVTGYYAAAEQDPVWVPERDGGATQPGGATAAGDELGAVSPAVRISLTLTGASGGQWLVANSPAARVLDFPDDPNGFFGVEYLYHPTAERLAEVTAPLEGPLGLTVRVPGKGVEKTYTVTPGQTIAVEGTPYTLKVAGVQPAMQLVSKGYEGTTSNSLMVQVTKKEGEKETTFNRMALFRYPERSPDFITGPDGKQKRVQDRVDNDIQIVFDDAQRDQFWVVEGEDGKLELVQRAAGGKVTRTPVKVGEGGAVATQVRSVPMTVSVLERTQMKRGLEVHVIPESQRKSGTAMDAMQRSAVEMEVAKGDARVEKVFVPFVQFAQVGEEPGAHPTVVDVPGAGKVGLLLSNTRRELPSTVKLANFEAIKYPGATNTYEDYVSTLEVKDKGSGQTETLVARLNAPAENHGLYYFQAAWDGNLWPGQRFSVLGVGNRPGIKVMILGALLMILGIGYAFYVKPILLKVKKQQLAEWAASRKGTGN
jgi:hypothetical protein